MPTNYKFKKVESSRDVTAFRSLHYSMLIIPSLQDDLVHVIIEGEFTGVTVNCLLTKEGIYNAYGIEI